MFELPSASCKIQNKFKISPAVVTATDGPNQCATNALRILILPFIARLNERRHTGKPLSPLICRLDLPLMRLAAWRLVDAYKDDR